MSIVKSLAVRAITLIGVLFSVLFIVAITLGATGFSERMLTAIVNEEVRGLRQQLVQTIRDSEEIERVIKQNPRYNTDEPGCFIATAVYGSNNSPEVKLLRLWRDAVLLKRYFGRIFVKFYYKVSPYIASVIEKNKLLKILFRYVIDRFVRAIKS